MAQSGSGTTQSERTTETNLRKDYLQVAFILSANVPPNKTLFLSIYYYMRNYVHFECAVTNAPSWRQSFIRARDSKLGGRSSAWDLISARKCKRSALPPAFTLNRSLMHQDSCSAPTRRVIKRIVLHYSWIIIAVYLRILLLQYRIIVHIPSQCRIHRRSQRTHTRNVSTFKIIKFMFTAFKCIRRNAFSLRRTFYF